MVSEYSRSFLCLQLGVAKLMGTGHQRVLGGSLLTDARPGFFFVFIISVPRLCLLTTMVSQGAPWTTWWVSDHNTLSGPLREKGVVIPLPGSKVTQH